MVCPGCPVLQVSRGLKPAKPKRPQTGQMSDENAATRARENCTRTDCIHRAPFRSIRAAHFLLLPPKHVRRGVPSLSRSCSHRSAHWHSHSTTHVPHRLISSLGPEEAQATLWLCFEVTHMATLSHVQTRYNVSRRSCIAQHRSKRAQSSPPTAQRFF